MPDYEKMYVALFNAVTDALAQLEEQRTTASLRKFCVAHSGMRKNSTFQARSRACFFAGFLYNEGRTV